MHEKPRKSIFFILPLIALVLMSYQFATIEIQTKSIRASGNLETETRDVTGFESVTLEGIGELTLIQGNEEELTIEADDNLLPLLRSEVRGRELVLKLADGYIVTGKPTVRFTLKLKELSRVSGNVNYYGTPEITQEMAGGGAIEGLGEHK